MNLDQVGKLQTNSRKRFHFHSWELHVRKPLPPAQRACACIPVSSCCLSVTFARMFFFSNGLSCWRCENWGKVVLKFESRNGSTLEGLIFHVEQALLASAGFWENLHQCTRVMSRIQADGALIDWLLHVPPKITTFCADGISVIQRHYHPICEWKEPKL